MRRVQSLEFNNNSYSSSLQQNKKVSLPSTNETDFAPKSSYRWLRRSTSNRDDRTTVVPITVFQDEIPNYFGSTMQSMCLAVFTLAYAEIIDGAVFSGNSMIAHAFLKFLTILCIGIALVAAFASIRVSILTSKTCETNIKNVNSDSPKIYSTLARLGSIIAAVACGIIICVFAAVSLYVLFNGRAA
ncbi:unnamed protein product [Rotaria socialis]|uniref:Uncharacterized protein n=1 Tax=Rotaria socialis TaxID=392032 RepID=A0A820GA11_9BILA|nr:unnamed protein product [Rotaria socialis]CAF3353506.1 unnamed protein product [Rotaria socialis]CAF3398002.1 unnamed protein product [Rotaria socialis]CAF3460439.1 unnamed protein product [Rotaria socialis]CAF3692639.1 unnamed protein product [Rotaria socialis]